MVGVENEEYIIFCTLKAVHAMYFDRQNQRVVSANYNQFGQMHTCVLPRCCCETGKQRVMATLNSTMSSKAVPAYDGEETIVVSIDIGTTHSAAAISYLQPGEFPKVESVSHWPEQTLVVGDTKFPTLIAYQNSVPKLYGTEAAEYLNDDEYEIARWFKLHLHPESMTVSDQPPPYGSLTNQPVNFGIPPLPVGVSLQMVYVDLLRYVWKAVRAFFEERYRLSNGPAVWKRLHDDIVIVLCVPNGWDISQHTFLRTAAIEAGLVTETNADRRLDFITEAEASVHFAMEYTEGSNWLKKGAMFAIMDAGGSTVDSTLYECKSISPLQLEEVCASECIQAGGVFVDCAAQYFLKTKLRDTKYEEDDRIADLVKQFEVKTKRTFDGSRDSNLVCGSGRDNDRSLGILNGRMTLTRAEIENMFAETILKAVDSCLKLLRRGKIHHLLLVGGFGESPYLRKRLWECFDEFGTEVVTIREPSKKAAAEGALLWFNRQFVRARAVRFTYGLQVSATYKESIHSERADLVRIDTDGTRRIQVFNPIIKKDQVITGSWEEITDYAWNYKTIPKQLGNVSLDIFVWEGSGMTKWTRRPDGKLLREMRCLCTIKADMSGLISSLVKRRNSRNEEYWQLKFQVVISFKRAKLQARLRWKEDGEVCEGPVSVLPMSTFQAV